MRVNFSIREVDKLGLRERRQFYGAKPQKERRHVFSKIKREVGMKIAAKDTKKCVDEEEAERSQIVERN